ncbi:DUF2127 domain-containing protein [Ethanoligenens harbinense]|uniref:DUF2127 domain-containing protein n=1 Tax=Ethanoligenens harbinense (strain DSM 18485 / JCM 12961 / CGMCC 1.5033 / YUAN-3) TaxID=663278 RepID=E6U7R6_ETHHY|nr:DUF2127 domain-containing protein [Ethanoligenens harbinense]ADU28189.1 Protein of unknown function DUF2127 [Ethanoligenens harbinense YUAN-3]
MANRIGKYGESLPAGDFVDVGFHIAVLCKGLGGLFELVGSVLLLFLNPARMGRLLTFVARRVLWSWKPVSGLLLQFGAHFSTGAQLFGMLYLLSHGAIKCMLMVLLWKKKLWAYPLAVLSILLFIGYQVYRIAVHPTFMMIALTVFDAAMIALTVAEYLRVRRTFAAQKQRA